MRRVEGKNPETPFPARRPCPNVRYWNTMRKKFATRHIIANSHNLTLMVWVPYARWYDKERIRR